MYRIIRRFYRAFGAQIELVLFLLRIGDGMGESMRAIGAVLRKERHSFRFAIRFKGRAFNVLFPSVAELYTLMAIFGREEYQVDSRPNKIVDLGANIGLATLYFLAVFPEASISSYEPDPRTFKYLDMNLRPYRNALAIEKAATGTGGPVEFYLDYKSSSSSIDPNWIKAHGEWEGVSTKDVQKVTVESWSLDQIIGTGIDLLKIDIEGAEFEVLGKCTRLSEIRVIVGETSTLERSDSHDLINKALEATHTVRWKSISGFTAIRKH